MTFNETIGKIMSEIQDGSKEPFLIYRDSGGNWNCDHTQNKNGEACGWVDIVKEHDHLAHSYTGRDFSNGSYPFVYDAVLCDRLRDEYYVARCSGKDTDDLHALVCFFNDNVAAFHHTVTDYLTTLDRPLAALLDICPVSMAADNFFYNESLAEDAVSGIESAVRERLGEKSISSEPPRREKSHERQKPKPPTLSEKLERGREKAREASANRKAPCHTPKKRDGAEVG